MLRRETVQVLGQINEIIQDLEDKAKEIGIPVTQLNDTSGYPVMIPVLHAKVMAIQTLAELNSNLQSRGKRD